MKKVINYLILIGLIALTIWIIVKNNDLSNLPVVIKQVDKIYILIATILMLLYWLMNAQIFKRAFNITHIDCGFGKAMKYTMIGQYYNALTPFASGGQPAQVYYMSKDSISVGVSTSILIIKYIFYQIVVTLYALIMFFFKRDFIYKEIPYSVPFMLIGISISFFMIVLIFILFLNSQVIFKISNLIFKLLKKSKKMLPKVDKWQHRFKYHVDEYMNGIKQINNNKFQAVMIALDTFIQLTIFYSITYFIYRAFGLNQASLMEIIALQSLLYMAIIFIPTPGAVGASEGGFHILFKVFFRSNNLVYAMIIWRIITYYFNIIFGGITVLFLFFINRIGKLVKQ